MALLAEWRGERERERVEAPRLLSHLLLKAWGEGYLVIRTGLEMDRSGREVVDSGYFGHLGDDHG